MALRDLRMKVLRCFKQLRTAGVVSEFSVSRISKGRYVVNARRGTHLGP